MLIIFNSRKTCAMNYSVTNSSISNVNYSVEDCSFPVAHGIALMTTNAMVCVLGTIGNILVCVAVVSNPRLRRSPNFLLFSLALADLIVTMICEPLFVVILGKKTYLNDCATDLELPNQILSRFSCTASVVHMAAISVDRFIAVVLPFRHNFIMERYGLKIMLIVSWVFPITVPVLNRFLPASFPKGFLGFGMFGFAYLIVFLSYSMIVISLVRHSKRTNAFSDVNSRVEVRVATTLAIVMVVFTASWTPFFVIFASTGKLLVKRYGPVYMWIRTLALSNSAMNFVIYGSRLQCFREGFEAICRKMCELLTQRFSRTVTYYVNK